MFDVLLELDRTERFISALRIERRNATLRMKHCTARSMARRLFFGGLQDLPAQSEFAILRKDREPAEHPQSFFAVDLRLDSRREQTRATCQRPVAIDGQVNHARIFIDRVEFILKPLFIDEYTTANLIGILFVIGEFERDFHAGPLRYARRVFLVTGHTSEPPRLK